MEFRKILERLTKKELILPDFQRGFIWDLDRMKKLYASILAKIPIGSILTLESSDDKFNCKQIGAKPRSRMFEKSTKTVDYLIDGQQRLTSLLAGFSTYYFDNFNGAENDIASNDLLSLYFLKVPAIDNSKSEDLFGVRDLLFKKRSFSSSEINSIIEAKYLFEITDKFGKKQKSFKTNNNDVFNEIFNYCTTSISDESGLRFYRIPIQFIDGESNTIAILRARILDQIANSHKGKKDDIAKNVWTNAISNYFTECLSGISLEEIKVENSDKARAIDIYNNLNQGGVKLSILDLIIATVGTKDDKNFYDQILNILSDNFVYDNNILSSEMKTLIDNQNVYNPFEIANVLTSKGEMKKMFTSVFLDVLALLVNKNKGKKFSAKALKNKEDKYFTPLVTKENEVLKLSADDVLNNYKDACKAIARALFFFQTRCGIREFDAINYKAQISVVAYFFSNDEYFNNKKIHDLFEYWYWISIFAWMYPSNQKIEILDSIEKFEDFIKSNNSIENFTYLKTVRSDVLKKKFYSDEETLTMKRISETEKYPPKVMTSYICQFYLSRGFGYKSFFIDTKHNKTKKDDINVFYDEKLEIHHLMPLGSDPNKKIGQTTKELRSRTNNPFNSPLNMLLITKNDNALISDMDYVKYSAEPEIKSILPSLDCSVTAKTLTDFLQSRFTGFYSKVESVLSGLEINLKNGIK